MKKQVYFVLLLMLTAHLPLLAQTVETVVGWSSWVYWSTRTADQGITGNLNVTTLNTAGANTPTFTDADGTGQRAMADGWASGANTKAWAFNFSTTKYRTMKFAGRLLGTNSFSSFLGPRDFKLQYSLNNSTWTDVSGGTMTAYNGMAGWNSYSNIALPAACENQPMVYMRLLMTSNTAVNGGTVSGGQSHFDDVNVTGVSTPEAPTDIALSNSILLVVTSGSSAASGTTIGNFSSTDFNLGNTHTYNLVSGSGSTDNSSFSITGNVISTAASLPVGTYSIRVRSTDNAGLWYEKVITITVMAPDAINTGSRQRISSMGTNGSTSFNSVAPAAITYNATNNEYLTVWTADDNTAPLVDNEVEVFAQRVNAATGALVGSRIRVSFMGANGTTTHKALVPAVTWNATNNEYFVIWQGDHNTGTLAITEDEIWGQRIDGSTGNLLGSMVRISFMGPDGNNIYDALTPDVTWNATTNQYLVVWRADDNTPPFIDNEQEIYAQLISNTGILTGSRIGVSSMGTAGSALYTAANPSVTWNATDNEFMIVWTGDDNTTPLVDEEHEIFGQRMSSTGALTGSRIRISNMGTDGSTLYYTFTPDVAWNSNDNEYYVVWKADDNTAPLVDNEYEIFGQRLSNTGVVTGGRTRISDMGPDGSTIYNVSNPKLMYHTNLKEYWVVWHGDDNATSVDNENEIYMQRITKTGAETGNNDIRVSFMGPFASTTFTALQPAIAYNSTDIKAFVVWHGDDNTAPLVDNEMEIFGQPLSVPVSNLPVRWLSFTANKQTDGTVKLAWETASEQNTASFTIQHSGNNSRWVSIDTIAAASNSNSTSRYSAIHQTPVKGSNQYRLLQTDKDGKSSYSKVINVAIGSNIRLSVFPNPAENGITVQLSSAEKSVVELYNSNGVLVMQKRVSGSMISIDVQLLAAGLYTVKVLHDGTIFQQSFMKN